MFFGPHQFFFYSYFLCLLFDNFYKMYCRLLSFVVLFYSFGSPEFIRYFFVVCKKVKKNICLFSCPSLLFLSGMLRFRIIVVVDCGCLALRSVILKHLDMMVWFSTAVSVGMCCCFLYSVNQLKRTRENALYTRYFYHLVTHFWKLK